MGELHDAQIEELLSRLNKKLADQNLTGELYLVGGAVMCLAFHARASTKDIDAIFQPVDIIREAANEIAQELHLDKNWLNDAVKGFLSTTGRYDPYLDLSHLKVFNAHPEYLFAMKCMAMRIGEEFHDLADVRYLLRYLGIASFQQALSVIEKYYPMKHIPQKTIYALEEMIEEGDF